ncbi:MAG: Trk system potassium transporter TrkA [Bacteroidia bacterium]|nr:MAG: Trk system potassium transporter TrkA [Bacteroidia bacterium]PIE86449.1 MAG: Trk system potassium transporter TrkA [Bacteroidia bacterium]
MKIIIAGAGEVGTYLAKMLSNGLNDITLIDREEENLRLIEASVDLLTVCSSATSITTLKNVNIKKADLFISVMESETTNIVASSLAKKLGVKKTIARVDNIEYTTAENKKYLHSLGLDAIIYPEILASEEIVNLLRQTGTTKTFDFSGGRLSLNVIKLDEKAPIINKTLIEAVKLDSTFNYRAVAITRNSETIIPHGNDTFMINDLVYVITNQSGVEKMMKYAGKKTMAIKNVMILGGSRIGINTSKLLGSTMNVKLLEKNKEKCIQIADKLPNTLVINADGKNIDVLIDEGLKNMDAFVAVTGDTETNILSCLLAKQYGVKRTIAEIENMDYVALASRIGIDTIIDKKHIAASNIFSFTMEAKVSALQCLPGTDAEVMEFVVADKAKITKKPLKEINFPKGAIIGGVIRGRSSFIATGDCHIRAEDKVVIFTLPQAIDKVVDFFK